MKLLKEALVDVKRLDDEETPGDEPDLDVEVGLDDSDELAGDQDADDSLPDDMDVDGSADGSADLSQPDPADPNADADSPWGALPSGGSSAPGEGGDTPDEAEPGADQETDGEIGAIADKASDDPNRQGLVRTVRGAHLVYKREGDDGSFEELWIYNVTTLQDEMTVRRAILAGTDIAPNKSSSPDGSQTYKVWSAGNAEMLMITGLQN